MHLRSTTSRPFHWHKTSKTPYWWLIPPHRPHTRTFLSPHMTKNTQSFFWQLWRQNCWKTFWPSNKYIKKTTMSLLIGMVKFYVELSWNGIMIKKCQSPHAKLRQHGSCTPTPSSSKKSSTFPSSLKCSHLRSETSIVHSNYNQWKTNSCSAQALSRILWFFQLLWSSHWQHHANRRHQRCLLPFNQLMERSQILNQSISWLCGHSP